MSFSHWIKRPFWQWIIAIIILAFLLRSPNIGRDSLWFDEAISFLAATLPIPQILNNTVQSSHPPLYYLLLHYWQLIVPDSDSALRGLGLLWNILLIPLAAQLGFDLFQKKSVAIVAALLIALSPFHILYSHELRMYTQLMFFACLGTWGYWRARAGSNWIWWGLFAIGFVAAVFTHLFAFLALAAIGIHALIYRENSKAFWRTAIIIAIICLLFLPWLNLMLAESQKALGSLRPLTTPASRNPVKPLTSLAFLLFGISGNAIYSGIILFLVLAIFLIMLMELRRQRQEGFDTGWVLLILLIGFVMGVPVVVYLIRPFFLPDRTMAAASPFLILLLAWSMTRQRTPLPYLVGISAIVMLVGSFLYHNGEPLKPPYREATQFIAAHKQERDVVLHTSDGSYLPALRYATLPTHALLEGDPDPRKPREVYYELGGEVWTLGKATSQTERIWVVVAFEHSIEWQQEQAQLIAASYKELEAHDFGGILVYLYKPLE